MFVCYRKSIQHNPIDLNNCQIVVSTDILEHDPEVGVRLLQRMLSIKTG
ncbi:hypothetical protein BMS3Bbin04_01805 [bacterium BMS3Bbin04]|nr:hypothetical protein BMS3Bbin04_01805 [bacterium BMS3Bbin04]